MPIKTIKLKRTNSTWEAVGNTTLQYGEPFFNSSTGDIIVGSQEDITVANSVRYFHSLPKALSDKGVFYKDSAPSSSSHKYLTDETGAGIFPYTTIENVIGSGSSSSSLDAILDSKANLAGANFTVTPQINGVNIITKNFGYVYDTATVSNKTSLDSTLDTWINGMAENTIRFFHVVINGTWSPWGNGYAVIFQIDKHTSNSGVAVGYGKSTSGGPRIAIMERTSGVWGDFYKILRADEDVGGVQSVRVQATSPIKSSQNTAQTSTLNTTISHETSGVSRGTYGSTTVVPKITVNETGHITSVSNQTIALGSLSGTLGTAHGGTGNTSVDTTPTQNSTKMVTSGGVWTALNAKQVFVASKTSPSNTNILWIDTTATTGGLKYYNGSAWVHVPVAFV